MTKAMIIINPTSGKEKAAENLSLLTALLQQTHQEVVVRKTQKEGDAISFANEACTNVYETVIAMGGDGTISETINGLAEQEHKPSFGIIPLGTVNDFARALNIPLNPEEAIRILGRQNRKAVDIGKVNDLYFMNVLAVGAIAEATYSVSPEQKTKLGSFAYFVEGAKALINKTPFKLTVEHDGGSWTGDAFLMVSALTNSVGGFESLAPQAEVNDGMIHCFIIKELSVPQMIKIVPRLLKGQLAEHDGVEYIRSRTLHVSSEEDMAVNLDGDEGQQLPFDATVLPGHLNIFVP
ncbi:diacylglycerol/lipid kinase family protein [Peribacillus sp. SCS-155]|uniref:diacylglycerol/lipid kinase family protein n=1 Tax=Peribacillus sedimenti TaxID=3115297 RepID=UPI003905D6BB